MYVSFYVIDRNLIKQITFFSKKLHTSKHSDDCGYHANLLSKFFG